MDFVRALSFPFDDDEWLKKLGIAVLVQFIPIVGQMILQGWSFQISQRVKRGDPEALPGWDEFGEFLRQGFSITLANLIYQIPTLIFICLASFAWVLPAASSGSDVEGLFTGLGVAATACLSCIILLYALAAAVVFFGGYVRYVDDPQLSVFFQFGENLALVREHVGDFGMAVLYILLAGVIVSAATAITAGIGALVSTPFIMYFMGHILGQLSGRVRGSYAAPAV